MRMKVIARYTVELDEEDKDKLCEILKFYIQKGGDTREAPDLADDLLNSFRDDWYCHGWKNANKETAR